MMLGYVHNTTKIWRIWDFNSGKTGRAVECSSVVFDEKEDAFVSSTGEPSEVVEFPNQTEEPQDETEELDEMNVERMDSSVGIQDSSKSITQTLILFSFRHRHLDLQRRKKRLPLIQLDCWWRGNLVIPVKRKEKKKQPFVCWTEEAPVDTAGMLAER
jgi:hypothetical protein